MSVISAPIAIIIASFAFLAGGTLEPAASTLPASADIMVIAYAVALMGVLVCVVQLLRRHSVTLYAKCATANARANDARLAHRQGVFRNTSRGM